MLKHLPRRLLPDPDGWLPTSGTARKVEGSLVLATGTIGLSLTGALLSGWFPTAVMASALSGQLPAVMTFLTAAWMALWLAYLLWRSKGVGSTWTDETLWLWGWGVVLQLLAGLGLAGMAALVFPGSVLG